jgi:tight adherence protein C
MIEFLANSSPFLILGTVVIAALGLGIVLYAIIKLLIGGSRLSARLEQVIEPIPLVDTNPLEKQVIGREISGSLFSRTVESWLYKFLNFLGRFTPQKSIEVLEHKLEIAGHPGNLHARQFYSLQFLFLLVGIFIAYFLNRDLSALNTTNLLYGGASIFVLYELPIVWLNRHMRTRQEQIERGLPDVLDMLSVCASAGLGFDQSLQKISQHWDTELGREFKRVTEEMELGETRSNALRSMSNRLDVKDLSQFIAIITQAEKIGMSYSDVLQSQALQMRMLRQQRVREHINQLPAKMVIPMALLIFPAILAVILVPIIPVIMEAFK